MSTGHLQKRSLGGICSGENSLRRCSTARHPSCDTAQDDDAWWIDTIGSLPFCGSIAACNSEPAPLLTYVCAPPREPSTRAACCPPIEPVLSDVPQIKGSSVKNGSGYLAPSSSLGRRRVSIRFLFVGIIRGSVPVRGHP